MSPLLDAGMGTSIATYFIAVCALFTWAGGLCDAWEWMKTRAINLLWPQLSALKKYEFKT